MKQETLAISIARAVLALEMAGLVFMAVASFMLLVFATSPMEILAMVGIIPGVVLYPVSIIGLITSLVAQSLTRSLKLTLLVISSFLTLMMVVTLFTIFL